MSAAADRVERYLELRSSHRGTDQTVINGISGRFADGTLGEEALKSADLRELVEKVREAEKYRLYYVATPPGIIRDPSLPPHVSLLEAERVIEQAREGGLSDLAKVTVDYDVVTMIDRLVVQEVR